ncbi:hypothetical protein [Pedobacter caeni]|uniref:Uncharacterized protein n=1 Tax=Pedobacter caeni TaxID=288992 RepID=A0A1M5J5W3_9SPHI|nr:hypothetical protein [Pedobacter caeni]SHG35932.1 hypothetical protein SAMN04488522_105211 [Pedobacter caeni]
MKKYLLLFIAMTIGMIANAQLFSNKQIFNSPDLKKVTEKHQIIAILPIGTKLSYRSQIPYRIEGDENTDRINTGLATQSRFFSYLLPKSGKMKIEIQDIEKTNLLLTRAGMDNRLDQYTKEEIAKALGVDAIVSGLFEKDTFISEDRSATDSAAVIRHLSKTSISVRTAVTFTLYDGQSGKQLWRYYNFISGTADQADYLIDAAVRNFPYIK